jgi:hypothetical protein
MASPINIEATLKAAGRGRHGAAGGVDALKVREVDALVARLLTEMEVPYTSLSKRVLSRLRDLKRVLAADYFQVPGLPDKLLLKKLAHIVENEIRVQQIWKRWDDPKSFGRLAQLFGPRRIDVRAEPYRRGAGLSLRGFFCRTSLDEQARFVIFLNTAHHPGAVAATFGHELGHYLYGSLIKEDAPMIALMEGTFANHLHEPHELFADALVALAAYNTDQIRMILGKGALSEANSERFLSRIQRVYEAIGSRLKLDLRQERISVHWRVSYLTSMIHFFKLRCAVLEAAGI